MTPRSGSPLVATKWFRDENPSRRKHGDALNNFEKIDGDVQSESYGKLIFTKANIINELLYVYRHFPE